MEPDLDEPKVGERYNTGQDMAADLVICPVPQGIEAHEIAVFSLAKGFLDHVPIKAREHAKPGEALRTDDFISP